VSLVIIDAAGDRAFSAGGDIQDLYRTGRAGDYDYGRCFWADEYRLNALIAQYSKPYVALIDGIVMGGGAGVSVHGSHRIVTEKAVFAMPECSIGLIPDVGVSHLLGQAPGASGFYIGLTGVRLKAADMIHTGIADRFVPHDRLAALMQTLCDSGDPGAIERYAMDAGESLIAARQQRIDAIFGQADPAAILSALANEHAHEQEDWLAEAAASLKRASPLSLLCAADMIAKARAPDSSVAAALAREYAFVSRCMEHGDFLEGIRAAVIDKDRAPHWRHASLDAARGLVDKMSTPVDNFSIL
jgi:enoyl-CoA hydratase